MKIREVKGKREKRRFVKLPWSIYESYPYWVPPLIAEQMKILDPGKNPFFEHAELKLLLAEDDRGRVVGRIAAIIDRRYIAYTGIKVGFFGFFESIEDPSVSSLLFERVEDWLRERGMERIIGPMDPSTNYQCGLLIEGFDLPPTFMMPYNPPYYQKLIEGYGFRKAKDLDAYFVELSEEHLERLPKKVERSLSQRNVRVRTVSYTHLTLPTKA